MERIRPFHSLLSRRHFLGTAGAAALAMASRPASAEAAAEPASMPNENVALTVNGRRHALDLDPRVTLLDALREHLGLRLVSLAAITVIVSRVDETQASIFHTRIA